MGKGVHRKGDATQGHGCWPASQAIDGSDDVRANGMGVVCEGDSILPHTCPDIPETHPGTYTGGGTVRANGKAIQVIGSAVSCGDKAAEGSDDVNVGN